jgi:hypothetical protein
MGVRNFSLKIKLFDVDIRVDSNLVVCRYGIAQHAHFLRVVFTVA